ncbi:hypothetical protein OVA29_08625 [Exiguobacterium sp. SL14]|nr:hypothetical protein [Exiguobacterium sp. SL14]MCY1690719.1 hypothetical protein [Exiguobacterium sp. SL14]
MIWETVMISVISSVTVNLIILHKKTHQLYDGLKKLEEQDRENLLKITVDNFKKSSNYHKPK